ncbi:ANTAR domain-containing protein [Amycolatopsis magusensis]
MGSRFDPESGTKGTYAAAHLLWGKRFSRLTASLLSAGTADEVLERIVFAGTAFVSAADLASVTMRGADGRPHVPVATDPVATALDQLQYQLGEGPGFDAAGACVYELDAAPRWPRWASAASGLGVRAVVSTAVDPGEGAPLSGTLNLYSRTESAFDLHDRNQALLLATHAALALARTDAVEQLQERERHLRRALDSRDVIGQAKGFIMHRCGCSEDEAFDILRRTSQRFNIKLAELAGRVVTHHVDPVRPSAGLGGQGDRNERWVRRLLEEAGRSRAARPGALS